MRFRLVAMPQSFLRPFPVLSLERSRSTKRGDSASVRSHNKACLHCATATQFLLLQIRCKRKTEEGKIKRGNVSQNTKKQFAVSEGDRASWNFQARNK